MNKNFIKKLGIILGITIGSIYGLFLIAPFIISPIINSYIPQINEEIQKATGLNSKIEKIRLVTTPKLTAGVKIEKFDLLTPNNKDILNAKDFEIKMSLLPLIIRKIELDLIKLDCLDLNLGINKKGEISELASLLDSQSDSSNSSEETEPFILPFGLKLSNHLPDIKIGNYNVTFRDLTTEKDYVISGNKTSITDFVLDKHVKINANGKVTLAGREQFKYNLKINNKIMPEMELNNLVFNPEPQEEKPQTEEFQINIIDIFKGLYDNQITANLESDIVTDKDGDNLALKGFARIDNMSVAPNGLKLPPSNVGLNFKGSKIDISSNLYTAQNEVSTLNGIIKTGKNTNIDLNFKSEAELANIVKILNAICMTFDIKDLQTLTANGKLDADFNIKSDLKKVNSNGYFKIPNANIRYGLYDVSINDINTDVALNNNNIDIKNISFNILSQPMKFYGTIKEDATSNLHLVAQNLSLKGLIVACGQAALLKENQVNSGTISLNADIVGKLDSIKPTAKIDLNNLNVKNVPASTVLKLPNTAISIESDGKTFFGNAVSSNIAIINPAATVSTNKISANIKEDSIEIVESPIKVEKINFNISGKISNYLTEKIGLDFITKGDINSALNGDMNIAKQTLNLNFSAPQNCSIIIPMFDKSKMVFRGSTTITGSMINPILTGAFEIPAISIPEIPITMDNLSVKLNGPIINGKANLSKFTSGGIVSENISTDFSMKGENFYLNNLKGSAFDGSIAGNIIYNMSNTKTIIDFKGSGMNAEKAILGAVGIKNALTGTLSFDTNLSLLALDYDQMMRSMKGKLSFKVENGAFGEIGRIENLLNAHNVVTNSILKTTVATLSNLSGIKNSAKFDYISGDMTFSNGWANLNPIKSSGPTLAYYVKGKYNLLDGVTVVDVLGRLDSSVVALLGPIGEVSASKLLGYIPKLGATTASVVNTLTQSPKSVDTSALPTLSNGGKGYKDFKVVFSGPITSPSSLKSFKWLAAVDLSEIEKINVVDTVKSLKTTVNTDVKTTVKTTVENAKSVVDTVKSQKDLIKNSAGELKSLLKF